MKIDTFESTMIYTMHSPYELAIFDIHFSTLGETDEIIASYVVQETVASDSLKDLTIKQRNCIFYDERHDGYKSYSYNLCVMRCRAARALELCNCKPHFYPFVDGPTCTIDGLLCLASHPSWFRKQSCSCLKPCTETVFIEVGSSKSQWVAVEGILFKQKASFRWEVLQPKTRFRRDVVFSFEDLLVSFAGGVSLFIGNNLFTLAQLVEFVMMESIARILMLIR
ncbi:sodium channel protein Nach-like [Toxorhynchites rutilus septentrionalis]|uniref:sodium channel protein Nach-like n=1 Tax=Toxorhynchites rutilus septentrionalis TaxID=329112 RepID=UPI0024798866|nr:sodium channel protein Nach-like [Toxorhynchites rutilus septentrionalis]